MIPFAKRKLRPAPCKGASPRSASEVCGKALLVFVLPALLLLPGWGLIEAATTRQETAVSEEVPDDRSARHVRYGKELHKMGDFKGAITVYTEAIRLDRYNVQAYYWRGVARAGQGDLDNALNDYSEAIDIDPEYYLAWIQRGLAMVRKKDYESALANFSEAIRLDGRNPLGWFERAGTRFETQDFKGSIKDYSEGLELKKNFPGALVNRGLAKARLGNIKGAIRDYEKALRAESGYARAFYLRGNAVFRQGNIKGAMSDFDRAIKSNPLLAGPYIMRGLFYYAQDYFPKALEDFTFGLRLIKDDGGKDYVNLWLWLTHSQRDDPEKAKKGLQKYLDKRSKRETGDWYEEIAHFLLGEIDEDTLLAAAVSQDQKLEKERLCEAYFYAAQIHLLNNDKAGAASLLRLCLATGIVDFYEFKGAKLQMLLLEKELGPMT